MQRVERTEEEVLVPFRHSIRNEASVHISLGNKRKKRKRKETSIKGAFLDAPVRTLIGGEQDS